MPTGKLLRVFVRFYPDFACLLCKQVSGSHPPDLDDFVLAGLQEFLQELVGKCRLFWL